MVKKYGYGEGMFRGNAVYVSWGDYLALQAALREALDGWEEWLGSKEDADRVEFLRAQFLGDK